MKNPTQENNNIDKVNGHDHHPPNITTMSDTESQPSQRDSFHSPFRSNSPIHSPDLDPYLPPKNPPQNSNFHAFSTFPADFNSPPAKTQNQLSPLVVVVNREVKEEVGTGVTKVGPTRGERRSRAAAPMVRRARKEVLVTRAALGFRVCEVVLCLISFSVMAADRTEGWSGDSFDRYKEYRYCLVVNIIAFVYAGFQACNIAYHLITEKYLISHHFHWHFDFAMDQILAYLLISASSSAATRVDDWVTNWGKDDFTEMATASISLSFLAFAAFALSSLISGYNLCNCNYTWI